jgi:hypothetical protein
VIHFRISRCRYRHSARYRSLPKVSPWIAQLRLEIFKLTALSAVAPPSPANVPDPLSLLFSDFESAFDVVEVDILVEGAVFGLLLSPGAAEVL